MSPQDPGAIRGITFAFAKLGHHAAQRFAERLGPLGLLPPHAGILHFVHSAPGQSQQALARHLGIPANRLVGLIDELEERGLVRRERAASDRRVHALHPTPEGEALLADVVRISAEQEAAVTAALDETERRQLVELLRRIAEQQGLAPAVAELLR